jgi:hypothetical protein
MFFRHLYRAYSLLLVIKHRTKANYSQRELAVTPVFYSNSLLITTAPIALRLPSTMPIGPRLDSVAPRASKAPDNLYIN